MALLYGKAKNLQLRIFKSLTGEMVKAIGFGQKKHFDRKLKRAIILRIKVSLNMSFDDYSENPTNLVEVAAQK